MKIVNLSQHGPDWHKWRSQGFGGSDAPVVMGDVDWLTVPELREVKAGTRVVEENYPMKRGKLLEPLARQEYMEREGIRTRPVCIIHDQYPWLRASLDGLSEDNKIILEIKCPLSLYLHRQALEQGQYPPKYRAQVQHQLFTAGLDLLHYVSFTDSKLFKPSDRYVKIDVKADPDYQVELFKREREEWERTNPDMHGLH